MKKQLIRFNHFKVEVIVLPNDGDKYVFELQGEKYIMEASYDACCFEGDRVRPFALAFREGCSWRHVVHECWHLLFQILRHMGGEQIVSYMTCESEIYAYRFTDLCDMVYAALRKLDPKEASK